MHLREPESSFKLQEDNKTTDDDGNERQAPKERGELDEDLIIVSRPLLDINLNTHPLNWGELS